jgi:hypothetical protein
MAVGLDLFRHVVVNHMGHVPDIQTAPRHVGCCEDAIFPSLTSKNVKLYLGVG